MSRRDLLTSRILLVGALWTAAAPASTAAQQAPASDVITAIEHVTVIDVVSGRARADQSIVLRGSRIVASAPFDQVRLSRSIRRINGRGAFAIPGLWDMHVHADGTDSLTLPLLVAHGVLGVRDMGSAGDDGVRWRAAQRAGMIAPKVVTATRIIDGQRGQLPPGRLYARTAAEGERAVDSVKALGADFVKVYEWLRPEAYVAIAARAKALGMTFAGHMPVFLSAGAASAAGQRSFEHPVSGWSGLLVDASREEPALRAELLSRAGNPDSGNHFALRQKAPWVRRLVNGFDARRLDSLAQLFAEDSTYQTPTLAITRSLNRMPDGAFATRRVARYVPVSVRSRIGVPTGPWWRQFDAEDTLAWRARDSLQLLVIKALHAAGAPILAGTDGGLQSALVPGPALHEELVALTEAGLSPLEALRAATINPALYFKATDSLGVIAPGKVADLVLLDANPLTDIHNTTRIRAVVLNGRYLDRAMLDAQLAAVVRRAARQTAATSQ